MIEIACGPTSKGTCYTCHETRTFSNVLPDISSEDKGEEAEKLKEEIPKRRGPHKMHEITLQPSRIRWPSERFRSVVR